MINISNELKAEINLLLVALGQPTITKQELVQLGAYCFKDFDSYSLKCQAIICVCLLYNLRGVPCSAKDLAYLQNLADCNTCGLNCADIGYSNNKIYAIGGNSGWNILW